MRKRLRSGGFGARRPGDRRRIWRQTSNASGMLMLAFAMFAFSGVDGYGRLFGIGPLCLAASEFRSARRGPPVKNTRPPWADRHDEIDRKHGVEPTYIPRAAAKED